MTKPSPRLLSCVCIPSPHPRLLKKRRLNHKLWDTLPRWSGRSLRWPHLQVHSQTWANRTQKQHLYTGFPIINCCCCSLQCRLPLLALWPSRSAVPAYPTTRFNNHWCWSLREPVLSAPLIISNPTHSLNLLLARGFLFTCLICPIFTPGFWDKCIYAGKRRIPKLNIPQPTRKKFLSIQLVTLWLCEA